MAMHRDHRLVPQRGFEDLRIGEIFNLPSRTVGDSNFAAFQTLSLDNHPIHYDAEYCKADIVRQYLRRTLTLLCAEVQRRRRPAPSLSPLIAEVHLKQAEGSRTERVTELPFSFLTLFLLLYPPPHSHRLANWPTPPSSSALAPMTSRSTPLGSVGMMLRCGLVWGIKRGVCLL